MDTRIRTAIKAEFEAGEISGSGQIRNVGDGGLFVGTARIPAQGDTVRLQFKGPDGAALDVSGLVWWTTAEGGSHRVPGFGLRLLDDSEDYRAFVSRLLHG